MPKRLPPGCIEDRDRHGNIRIYYRAKGLRKTRLDKVGAPWSKPFMDLYEQAVAGSVQPAFGEATLDRTAAHGTWRWLVLRYFRSADWQRLADNTRRNRRAVLESTFDEPVRPDSDKRFAAMPLEYFNSKAVRVLRDRKGSTPAAANNRIKAIAGACKWAVAEELIDADPTHGVGRFKLGSTGHHAWSEAEIRKYEAAHPLGTKARLALDIFVYTGLRRSDAVEIGRQHFYTNDAGETWLRYTLVKNRQRKPITIDIPVLAPLLASIKAATQSGVTGDLTFLVTQWGKPHTANGFGCKVKCWCIAAGLPHCSAHGLRKASATIAAENGATEFELMAIYGWSDAQTAAHYVKSANRKRLSGKAGSLIRREQTGN